MATDHPDSDSKTYFAQVGALAAILGIFWMVYSLDTDATVKYIYGVAVSCVLYAMWVEIRIKRLSKIVNSME